MRVSRLPVDSGWNRGDRYAGAAGRRPCARGSAPPSKGLGVKADVRIRWRSGGKSRAMPMVNSRITAYGCFSTTPTRGRRFFAERLLTAEGGPGSLSVFRESPAKHRMFSEHVASEYPDGDRGDGEGGARLEAAAESGEPLPRLLDRLCRRRVGAGDSVRRARASGAGEPEAVGEPWSTLRKDRAWREQRRGQRRSRRSRKRSR